jgi:hypothetical protein
MKKGEVRHRRHTSPRFRNENYLSTGIHILNAIALVVECAAISTGPELPAAILALVLVGRWADHRIAARAIHDAALDALFVAVYAELRSLARNYLNSCGGR